MSIVMRSFSCSCIFRLRFEKTVSSFKNRQNVSSIVSRHYSFFRSLPSRLRKRLSKKWLKQIRAFAVIGHCAYVLVKLFKEVFISSTSDLCDNKSCSAASATIWNRNKRPCLNPCNISIVSSFHLRQRDEAHMRFKYQILQLRIQLQFITSDISTV